MKGRFLLGSLYLAVIPSWHVGVWDKNKKHAKLKLHFKSDKRINLEFIKCEKVLKIWLRTSKSTCSLHKSRCGQYKFISQARPVGFYETAESHDFSLKSNKELQSRPRAFMYCRRKYSIKHSNVLSIVKILSFKQGAVLSWWCAFKKPSHDFFWRFLIFFPLK